MPWEQKAENGKLVKRYLNPEYLKKEVIERIRAEYVYGYIDYKTGERNLTPNLAELCRKYNLEEKGYRLIQQHARDEMWSQLREEYYEKRDIAIQEDTVKTIR